LSQTLSNAPLEIGFVSAVIRQAFEIATSRGRSCEGLLAAAQAWRNSLARPASQTGRSAHLQAFLSAWHPAPDAASEAWRLARRVGLAHWGSVGYGLMTAPSALAGLEFDLAWQSLACVGVSVMLHGRGTSELTAHADSHGLGPVFWAFVLGCRQVLLEGCGGRVSDWTQVALPCGPNAALAATWRDAGIPVRFGAAVYSECFDVSGLRRPNPCSSPSVHQLVAQETRTLLHPLQLANAKLLDAIRGFIRGDLDAGLPPTLTSVAPRLSGLGGFGSPGVRQLQRRLAAHQTGFRELVAEVRQVRALEHLRHSRRPVADIAAEAGYAELSSFHRAVRRWTGCTPLAYRLGAAAPVCVQDD
jgi:hypothetical protein